MNITINKEIRLRRILTDDCYNFVRYLNDQAIYNNTLKIPYPYQLSDADRFINSVLELEETHGIPHHWVIEHKEAGVIGSIGLHFGYGLDAHKDEIGYWLARPFWGEGIMTAVIERFCEYCFSHRELSRIEALVFSTNIASCRVLEKTGFVKEGYLKKYYIKNGRYIDAFLYANVL